MSSNDSLDSITTTTIQLPVDVVCERVRPTENVTDVRPSVMIGSHSPDVDDKMSANPSNNAESDQNDRSFSVVNALKSVAQTVPSLGVVSGEECLLSIDAQQGTLCLQNQAQNLDKHLDGETTCAAELVPAVPEGWIVRDVGVCTIEVLRQRVAQCRGVVWNGALGVWEDERWQKGTRAFIASIERRLEFDNDEEGSSDDAVDVDDGDVDVNGVYENAAIDRLVEESEFEMAIVLGQDSARLLPSLMDSPSLVSFVSQSGNALLQLMRGKSLPGLLACAEKPEKPDKRT